MVTIAISPFLKEDNIAPDGVVLTSVLPGGCQMACPYCFVAMRQERKGSPVMTPDALASLSTALSRRGMLAAASVIGDEPLQKQSWPYVEALLAASRDAGAPTGIVTNGCELESFLPQLCSLDPSRVMVSLDGIGARHDKLRRTPGAFARIDRGLRAAVQGLGLHSRLAIASVIMPGNADDILDVVDFAAQIGVPQVVVSPLLMTSNTGAVQIHPKIIKSGWYQIEEMLDRADKRGIDLVISDEFSGLEGKWQQLASSRLIRAPQTSTRLIRVNPIGQVSTYGDIRAGAEPSLNLPYDLRGMDDFADLVIEVTSAKTELVA